MYRNGTGKPYKTNSHVYNCMYIIESKLVNEGSLWDIHSPVINPGNGHFPPFSLGISQPRLMTPEGSG